MKICQPQGKFKLNGIEIDDLTLDEACIKIEEAFSNKRIGFVFTPNAQHIVCLGRDAEFKEAYKNAFMRIPDGVSIIFASWLLGNPIRERAAGSDLFPRLCRMCWSKKKKIFLLGGVNGSEKTAVEKLRKEFQGILVDSYSPPFGFEYNKELENGAIKKINIFGTDLLVVCLGAPKSEKWIDRNWKELKVNIIFSLGSSIDFYVGAKKRAPIWIQRMMLEWLFRLIKEPRRLWRRYLFDNIIFIFIVLKELFIKKYSTHQEL